VRKGSTYRKRLWKIALKSWLLGWKYLNEFFITFKDTIIKEWESDKSTQINSLSTMQWQLLSIKSKMDKIEERLLSISNTWLVKRLEDERSTLETLLNDLTNKINNRKSDTDKLKKHYRKLKTYLPNLCKFEKKQLWFKAVTL